MSNEIVGCDNCRQSSTCNLAAKAHGWCHGWSPDYPGQIARLTECLRAAEAALSDVGRLAIDAADATDPVIYEKDWGRDSASDSLKTLHEILDQIRARALLSTPPPAAPCDAAADACVDCGVSIHDHSYDAGPPPRVICPSPPAPSEELCQQIEACADLLCAIEECGRVARPFGNQREDVFNLIRLAMADVSAITQKASPRDPGEGR